jgi:phosphopantothenoylcysteine decarboxylase/phosphopantothenate--cysteine ligase
MNAAMQSVEGRNILLIVGGGIAAYKALDLIRRLRERGAHVRAVLTRAGERFVTPLSVTAISGERALTDLFDPQDEHDIGHIRLSRETDLIVIAPATADLLAKMAHGLADDLASAVLLASDKPVLAAPAMNPRMWAHPATRRNFEQLSADGVTFIGPEYGDMAERGEAGFGRLAEPQNIVAAIERHFSPASRPLGGLSAVVTAGPTHEPIDPVRYIANRSSGRQGYAIAAALAAAGAEVTLVSGPVTLKAPAAVKMVPVETARQMRRAVEDAIPADIAVMAAAVGDWRVDKAEPEKIKKGSGAAPRLALVENPDILAGVSHHQTRPRLIVGFAAETENVVANAVAKLRAKGCDWIVANDVSPETGVMGGERNRVHLVSAAGVEDWPDMTKPEVAARLVARIARHFAQAPAAPSADEPPEPPAAEEPGEPVPPQPEPPPLPATPMFDEARPVAERRDEPKPAGPERRIGGSLDIRPTR